MPCWHVGTKLQTSIFFLQAVKKLRMILKYEISINCASPVWQGNLSHEQGLSKWAASRKYRGKEKVRVMKGEIAQLASHPSKVQVFLCCHCANVGEIFHAKIHLQ